MHARAAAAVPHIGHVRRAGGDAVVPAHLVLDALAPVSLTQGRRPPPGGCAHGVPVPSREDEASGAARRARRACSHSCVAREVEHKLAMLLERLLGQDLREEGGRVGLAWDMADGDAPSAAQLTQLEQLPIDVSNSRSN